ncbi:MAG: xanthine dehydrogenase family protein molybdopterin-binding subunit [Acidimicrobiia bacterium]|nr:xanthine dehydrogenase family protein molybdopterin-binding subunit [Acidimicrobiia bacterium]
MKDQGVGARAQRIGGVGRVTGGQRYVADIPLADMLHAKLVTLDCAHARILSIDTSAAIALPGVHFVMTPDDLPKPMPRFGPEYQDRPVMADGETKYHGEAVAAVVADTKDIAEEAALLVKVEYEVLPAIHTLEEALAPGAELVQDPAIRRPGPHIASNILSEYRFGWGDVDAAAADADIVVENTYDWPSQTQFAIEPHGFIAAPDGDGIAVWSSIQHPYQLQKTVAKVLGIPMAKVRVFAPDPGGGFGGKQHTKLEPLVAFMAVRAGQPVRLILTLEEAFQAVRSTGARMRVRTGIKADGTLVFQDFVNEFLVGCYGDTGDRVSAKGSFLSAGPYRTPAVRIVSRAVLSHTTPTHPMRGFGIPQVTWARESNLDEAAIAAGVDRLEIRLKNLVKYGEEHVPGDTPADGDWAQTVRKAAEEIGWGTPVPPGRGRGIAIGLKSGPTTGLSYSTVRFLADCSAIVFSGTSDMGQGARTIYAQIVAEELGIPLDSVSVVMGDTAVVPYDQQTSASRSSVLMGNAVLNACRDIQRKLKARMADMEGIEEAAISVDRGVMRLPGGEEALPAVLKKVLGRMGGEIVGNGEARKDALPEHPLGGTALFFEFNCTAIEAEVDEETGETDILRHVTVGDVGLALNPIQVTGQDEGAAVMGVGLSLMEHLIWGDDGRTRNLGAIDYRIPTSLDLPRELHSFSVENGDGPGPYGVKGISEGSLLCTAPAVAAAVRDATGAVIRDLPLSPERVWRALQERP